MTNKRLQYVALFDEAKFKQVNPINIEYLNEYLEYLKQEGKSDGVIKQQNGYLRGFLCYNYDHGNKPFNELTIYDINVFTQFIYSQKKNHVRKLRFQASLRNWNDYLASVYPDKFTLNMIKSAVKKAHKPKVNTIKDSEILEMLQYLVQVKDYNTALYLSFIYDTGILPDEVPHITKRTFLSDTKDDYTNPIPIYLVGQENPIFRSFVSFGRTQKIADRTLYLRGNEFKMGGKFDAVESLITPPLTYSKCLKLTPKSYKYRIEDTYELVCQIPKKFKPDTIRKSYLANMQNGTHYGLKRLHKDYLNEEEIKKYDVYSEDYDKSFVDSLLKG